MHLATDIHDGFVLPNARFNPTAQPPSCSGLLTPPESPTSCHTLLPVSAKYPSPAQDCRAKLPSPIFGSGASEHTSPNAPPPHDLSRVSETIYTIIEQVIEQKLAEAMGPLRLNIRRFDSENTDLGCQVGHLEQQLDSLQNISATTSNNLELLSSIANQLSQAVITAQRSNSCEISRSLGTASSSSSSVWQHQHHRYSIQPQFCFEPRSVKRQHRSYTKSRKFRLINYMLSKWRTGGARD